MDKKELGITPEYQRSNYDSDKRKKEYKEKIFDGRKVVKDPVTGKELHASHRAAQNKYHRTNKQGEVVSSSWAEHSAEIDHVVPLKEIHERNKRNPYLSDKDVMKIANKDHNFRNISKKLNASKQDKSDFDLIFSKDSNISTMGKVELFKGKMKAEVGLGFDTILTTSKNIGNEFVYGASNTLLASVVPITTMAVQNMVEIAQGEKTVEDATKDMGVMVGTLTVLGGVEQVVTTGLSNVLKNTSNQLLKQVSSAMPIAPIFQSACVVLNSTAQLISGQLDVEQFMLQIGKDGIALLGGTMGTTLALQLGLGTMGAFCGGIVGSMIASTVCAGICTGIQIFRESLGNINTQTEIDRYISQVSSQALSEIKEQQDRLQSLIQERNATWNNTIIKGYEKIQQGILHSSFDEVVNGLTQLGSIFGVEPIFKKSEDIEKLFEYDTLIIGKKGGVFL